MESLPLMDFAASTSMIQLLSWSIVLLFPYSSVLAGGTFPGPLITARKVRSVILLSRHLNSSHNRQGDPFSVNVINNLKNGTMDLVTAIVSVLCYSRRRLNKLWVSYRYSIGTVSPNTLPHGLMALHLSRNAQSFPANLSVTSSILENRSGLTGTIHTTRRNTATVCGESLSFMIQMTLTRQCTTSMTVRSTPR